MRDPFGAVVGFNRASGFSNSPTIFEALPNNNFSSNTTTAFTYTLGIGIERALTQHCRIGIGYEFADWGRSKLGRALGQTINGGLVQNHLYTNSVLFNITYLT